MVLVKTAFTVLLMVSLLGIAACSDDDGDEGATATGEQEGGKAAGEETGKSADESGEPIRIKTHLAPVNANGETTGEVLPGSTIGDAEFCVGARFGERKEPGSDLVTRIFRCSEGTSRSPSPRHHPAWRNAATGRS